MSSCRPVGSALPPRRDQLITVASADHRSTGDSSIIVPLARERLQDIFEREQGPQRVKRTLESAFSGDLHHFQLLVDAMMDSWPLAQKNIAEVGRRASTELWETHPYAPRNQKATPEAEKLADEVYDALIAGMRPTPGTSEQDFEGMVIEMTRGYFSGHYVGQVLWETTADAVRPRGVQEIRPPRYAYAWDGADRLLVDLSETGTGQYQDFPRDSFLIAINKGHSAHASVAAPLRALMGYWLAAVYGLKWFSGFCELFGIPWRHAKSDDVADHGKLARALALFGSRGYAVTKTSATLDLVEAAGTGASLPQKELIELADRQCNLFILGQTLTSGTDSSGSRALGDVHERTLENVVWGVSDWIGKVLSRQLVPAYIRLNYGEDRDDAPGLWPKREAVKDEKAMAERDNLLGITNGSTPVEAAWFYERHGIPIPKEGDQIYQPNLAPATPASPGAGAVPLSTVAASDATPAWEFFPEECCTLGIPRAEMPQISAGNRPALVNFFRARGIDSTSEEVFANTLLPSQAEYCPAKVDGARQWKGASRSVLISADNYVVDGHHQWLAADGGPLKVIRLAAPITRILMMAHRMPSTQVAASEAVKTPTIERLMENVRKGMPGATSEWLAPVRPFFEKLVRLAEDENVTEADFQQALKDARKRLPDLFEKFDTAKLEKALKQGMGAAVIAGSTKRYES
jgi:phage gp29-like protein